LQTQFSLRIKEGCEALEAESCLSKTKIQNHSAETGGLQQHQIWQLNGRDIQ
jgi:hypothetical protein